MKLKKEEKMVERYNEKNPGNPVDLVIDNFKKEFWFTDRNTGRRLSVVEEKKIWDCGE